MKDYSTNFPYEIDDLHFFQDISIDKLPIMEHYNSLIASGAYTAASDYINDQDVTFYGAWFLKMLEERFYILEEYVVHWFNKCKIVTSHYVYPGQMNTGFCWTPERSNRI